MFLIASMFTVVCGQTHPPKSLSAVLRAYLGNTQDDPELCTLFRGEAADNAVCKNFGVEAKGSDQELFVLRSANCSGYSAHYIAVTDAMRRPRTVTAIQEPRLTQDGCAALRKRPGLYHHVFGKAGTQKEFFCASACGHTSEMH